MKILITICARAGSKRLTGKNIKFFNGKPLIVWTVEQALAFKEKWECDIVVCSDIDIEFLDFWGDYPAVLNRPKELCGDDVPKLDVIRYVLRMVESRPCCDGFDAIIDLDVTNPCRKPDDIEKALQIFQENWPDIPTVFSVTHARRNPYFNQVEYGNWGNRLEGYRTSKSLLSGFKAKHIWDMNASILIMKSVWLRQKSNLHPVCSDSKIYLMDDWQAFDIDHQVDFEVAEYLFGKHLLDKGVWIERKDIDTLSKLENARY